MLERLLEQKKAVALYSQDHEISVLNSNQWILMEKIVQTLRPFEQETKKASLNSSTAGIIIPSVRMLSHFLQQPDCDVLINAMKQSMLKNLNDRYSDIEKNKICFISTILDPTAKLHFFSNENKDQAKEWLLEAAIDIFQTRQPAVRVEPESNNEVSTESANAASNVLYGFWQEIVSSQDESNVTRTEVSARFLCLQEVTMYLTEHVQPIAVPPAWPDDPINYWKKCHLLYPNLAVLAGRFLGSPSSSVDSERAFSTAGNICSDKRSSLSPQKLEMLIFLQKNITLLEFSY